MQTQGQYPLLIMDSYTAHAGYKTLSFLKKHNIILIDNPSHPSYMIQPLDCSVFSSFKSFVCRAFHKLSRSKKVVHSFDVCNALRISFQLIYHFNCPIRLRTLEVACKKQGRKTFMSCSILYVHCVVKYLCTEENKNAIFRYLCCSTSFTKSIVLCWPLSTLI